MLSLHDEVMERYHETLAKWDAELRAEEMPALISTYNLASPDKLNGYKVLITTLLIDEVNEERIAGVVDLITKLLRRDGNARG